MGEGFGTILRTYCLESTLVSLKYFYLYPGFISRCFWALNILMLLMTSCAVTWLLYGRFAEMPTRLTIENQFEPLYNLPYPSVTLCSPNQMTLSGMDHFNKTLIDGNLTIDLERALPLLLGFYEQIDEVNEYQLSQLQRILDANRYTMAEVMGKMPQSCDRFLRRCALANKVYKCSELFKPIITTHGYCCNFNSKYTFNGKDILVNHDYEISTNYTIQDVGYHSALTVICDYEPEDVIPDTLLNAGSVRIMLTDWTEFPVDYETCLVDSNTEAFLLLHAFYIYCSDEVSTLPPWSRNCYFEHEHELGVFRQYHNSDCDLMCYILAVWKTCKCWLHFLPSFFLQIEKICKATHIPCIMDVKKNMSSWLTSELCVCPRDCESRRYRADLNIGNFRAIPYRIESQNLYRGMQLNGSSFIMNFIFQKEVYVKLKQETIMSITSLVSNLGGVFGLFMGCSGVSVLEIGFYIYKGIRHRIASRRDKRRQNTQNAVGFCG